MSEESTSVLECRSLSDAMQLVASDGTMLIPIKKIEKGGCSSNYLARDLRGRKYFVKTAKIGASYSGRTLNKEINLLTEPFKTEHPNIIEAKFFRHEKQKPLIDAHNRDAYKPDAFHATEFTGCGDLDDLLKWTGKMDYKNGAELFYKICDGVQYLHERGLTHQDLKPANILMKTPDEPLVCDLGLVKRDGSKREKTMSGTPHFMAPEKTAGHVTKQSDVYSLGLILYKMLTGSYAFEGSSFNEVLGKQLNADIPDPCAVNPDIPRSVAMVLYKATNKNPAARHQNAKELADDLKSAVKYAFWDKDLSATHITSSDLPSSRLETELAPAYKGHHYKESCEDIETQLLAVR